jgi:hypothetical protein
MSTVYPSWSRHTKARRPGNSSRISCRCPQRLLPTHFVRPRLNTCTNKQNTAPILWLQFPPMTRGPAVLKIRTKALIGYLQVDGMRKFVMMNTLAVVKITKKHDKHSERHLQADMVAAVHRHHFYSSPRFGTVRLGHIARTIASSRNSHVPSACNMCMQERIFPRRFHAAGPRLPAALYLTHIMAASSTCQGLLQFRCMLPRAQIVPHQMHAMAPARN